MKSNQQVILITGASSGMGKDAALTLLQEGYTVYGAARRVERLKEIETAGGHVLKMDITREEEIKKVVTQIIDREGRIDVLINNAGYGLYGAVEDVPLEKARYQFEVNLFGLARLTQLVLPHMREKGSGRIINMSSMGGKIYTPLGSWYHASKHALEGWSDCLRFETKPFGIDVVIVEPGIIRTEFGEVMLEQMMETSGDGPYQDLAHTLEKATKDTYSEKNSSPPSVISKVLLKAIRAKNPKTRYAAGKMAKLMIFLRTYLGDRLFDKILAMQVK